jgi:hypothetical protein
MNFWNWLRWACAALFLVWIVVSLVFAHPHFDFSGGAAQDAPRPAPLIVH